MKRDKYLGIIFFLLFSSAGAYLLHDSIHDPGPFADTGVIVGAVFTALALAAMSWTIRQHMMTRALQRHLRRHHS